MLTQKLMPNKTEMTCFAESSSMKIKSNEKIKNHLPFYLKKFNFIFGSLFCSLLFINPHKFSIRLKFELLAN